MLAAAIQADLESHPNVRVPVHRVLVAAAAVDRTAAATVGWRSRVLDAIADLVERGAIRLPKTSWDRTASPALPAYVEKITAAPEGRSVTSRPVWHADMSWAARLSDRGELGETDRRRLTAVNAWLPTRTGTTVPMRERSLDIFDDEKVLDTVVLGPMFAPGRLTWQLLEMFPCWPPVDQTILGDTDWLVIENYTTYRSIARRAGEMDFDGRIIWGSGNQVSTRLSALSEAPKPQRCWYFGDIDAGGFRVAKTAARRAELLELPALTPARGLYRLALAHGKQHEDEPKRLAGDTALEWIRSWAGGALGDELATVVERRRRIVQEYVGQVVLAATSTDSWFGEPGST